MKKFFAAALLAAAPVYGQARIDGMPSGEPKRTNGEFVDVYMSFRAPGDYKLPCAETESDGNGGVLSSMEAYGRLFRGTAAANADRADEIIGMIKAARKNRLYITLRGGCAYSYGGTGRFRIKKLEIQGKLPVYFDE